MSLTYRLKELFNTITEDGLHQNIKEYYDDDVILIVNGFRRHLSSLTKEIQSRTEKHNVEVCIIEGKFIEVGNVVGSTHQYLIKFNDNIYDNIKADVIGVYIFNEDLKLSSCDEVYKFDLDEDEYDKLDGIFAL